jgi:diaminopimelate decarboxylase
MTRLITGNAGVLVSRVIYVKDGESHRFVIVDAAMNDLVRPAMYDAYHGFEPVAEPAADAPLSPATIVGPVCETADTFAKDRLLPPLAAGDLTVFHSAGAYAAVMASTYNTRLLVPEVLVEGDRYAVVRRRPSYEELLELEARPDWLA